MSTISAERIQALSELVRIDLTYGKTKSETDILIGRLSRDLALMIESCACILSAETADLQALYTLSEDQQSLRLDEVHRKDASRLVQTNAPEYSGDYYVVPPVL